MGCARCQIEHPIRTVCPSLPGSTRPEEGKAQGGLLHGPLVLQKQLGSGATGTVYLAQHMSTGAEFALKVLHPHLASNAAVKDRFYVEAHVASRVVHPSVPRILDARPGPGGLPSLLMEYVSGEPFSSLPLPLPSSEVVWMLGQVLEGLEVAHARGVVHRDLKPDNLVLTRPPEGEPRVKVLDFGMVSVLAASFSQEELNAGMALGSPAYMAPEQWETTAADTRMDVYSLGVVGYRLVTGRLPFGGGRMGEVLLGQPEVQPLPPHVVDARVPRALSEVLMRAIARRPEDRFQSAQAFRAALLEAAPKAPVREATPVREAAPEAPATASLQVRVRGLGGPGTRTVNVQEVRPDGLFIAYDGPLPARASRLPMELTFQGKALLCIADVVRHVSTDEARILGIAAGFSVRFAEPSEPLRQMIAQVLPRTAAPSVGAPPAEPPVDPELAQLLSRTAALMHDPYVLLGLAPSASFDEVRQRAETALRKLDAFRQRPLPAGQRKELMTLGARVDAARRTLGDPLSRVGFDATRGNTHGIARCLAAGVSQDAVEPLRRAYLTARPGAEEKSRTFLVRARQLETQNALRPAIDCYAKALALDPLNLPFQRHYWTLQRQVRAVTTVVPAVAM
ncbi:Serine/threonine protein kinase [Stigmatella aurantiaca DW4/3-1]|uniref:Serine/threonine protein kinase n=1 Tax=Stigmatella aurantiaca (strain DW4/3-1) TaxID=378806 RepID=Q09AB2_STIAD|nr:Serine/threonine protein kinase [Stigmatella aurantiaca DW4/3-1]EAU68669.1 serine/threonine-protein kinase Pkn1 [Stigmatella aurantiaca DW4/3-1]